MRETIMYTIAAARRPPSEAPSGKPQNIITVIHDRMRDGKYSEVIAIAFAMPPPSPMSVKKRNTLSEINDCAAAEAKEKVPKAASVPIITFLRPIQSASGAIARQPIKRPTSPLTNTIVKACGGTCQSLMMAGAR